MKITLICVGKIKESYWQDAIKEYSKRLSKYCKLAIIAVEDEKTPDRAGEALNEQIKAKEAERILAAIEREAYVITLEISGRKMNSEGLAGYLEKLMVQGNSHVQLIIGGSLGLHSSVSTRANLALSFSDLTFPHQLMRVILLEQIYRSFRIMAGEPYHK